MPLQFGDIKAIQLRDAKPTRVKQMRMKCPPPSKERRPFTDLEKRAALAIAKCRFLPGSWDKRFARDVGTLAENEGQLTERMAWHIWRVVYRYRRQVHDPELTQHALNYLT